MIFFSVRYKNRTQNQITNKVFLKAQQNNSTARTDNKLVMDALCSTEIGHSVVV